MKHVTREMLRQYYKLSNQITALTAEKKILHDEIMTTADACGETEKTFSEIKYQIVEKDTKTFDRKAFVKAHPEMLEEIEKYTKVTHSRTLLVK